MRLASLAFAAAGALVALMLYALGRLSFFFYDLLSASPHPTPYKELLPIGYSLLIAFIVTVVVRGVKKLQRDALTFRGEQAKPVLSEWD